MRKKIPNTNICNAKMTKQCFRLMKVMNLNGSDDTKFYLMFY